MPSIPPGTGWIWAATCFACSSWSALAAAHHDSIGTVGRRIRVPRVIVLMAYEHMLDQVARHGMIDLEIDAQGDLHIDAHHTVEDISYNFV